MTKQLFKKVTIDHLRSGHILLHPLFRLDGLMLVARYKQLTDSVLKHINKQFSTSLPVLIVESEQDYDTFEQDKVFDTDDYREALQNLVKEHNEVLHLNVTFSDYADPRMKPLEEEKDTKKTPCVLRLSVENVLDQFIETPSLKERGYALMESVEDMVQSDEQAMAFIKEMKSYHDSLFLHSVNTASIAFVIGLTLEMTDDELIDLIITALFADLGFTEFPSLSYIRYLNSGKREKELERQHIEKSVEKMAACSLCRKKAIIYGLMDHHEAFDGHGPSGKQKTDIHLYGRIIAIAQKYDELVGGYVEESSHHTISAQQHIWDNRSTLLDPHILRIFIDRIAVYKIGQSIVLPDHRKGTIIGFTDYIHKPLQPVVKTEDGAEIDLVSYS